MNPVELVPATFYWKGVDNTFALATNWFTSGQTDHTIPVAKDTIVFGTRIPLDTPVLPGEPPMTAAPSVVDCDILQAYEFDGFYLGEAYTGTVKVRDNTSAVVLDIRNGAIAQAEANDGLSDFTVTGYMYFIRGTFNSLSTNGMLHLAGTGQVVNSASTIGATGTATNTVTMGSVLEIGGFSTLVYTNGTIAFSNSAYFDCRGTVTPASTTGNSAFTFAGAVNKPHLVRGIFTLKSNSQQGFFVSAGDLNVIKSLTIAGHIDPAVNTSASLGMTGGTILGTNNTELIVDFGLSMNGGTLKTTSVGITTTNNSWVLVGNMVVSGTGVVDLYQDANGVHLGSLSVIGNVYFLGGEYKAKIVGAPTNNERERNRWMSTGTFTTAAAALITPIVTSTTTLPPKVANAPLTWNVITATGEVPANTVLPTVGGGFVGVLRPARVEYDLQW